MDAKNKEHDALTLKLQNEKQEIAQSYLTRLQNILELDSEE